MGYTIAKYIRLSVDDAKSESMSIENQRLFLDGFIAAMDETDATVLEFVDNGYSGTHFERPAIQELLELVRSGSINCIVVKDFSRFGRNMIEAGYFLQMVFPLFRTRFIAVSDAFDSAEHDGDTGGLEVAFKLLISEQYSRDISQKIKTAKRSRALRGEHVVKNCAFGFRKVGNRLEIDEPAAATIRLIFELAADGQSLAKIAARLYSDKHPTPTEYKQLAFQVLAKDIACLWGKPQIMGILSDEQYIGTYTAGKTRALGVGSGKAVKVDESEWIKIPNHHPAIIDRAVFDAAHTKIDQRGDPLRKRRLGTWERYKNIRSPLQGYVFCGCCNHTMKLSSTMNAAFHCDFTRAAPDTACYRLKILNVSLLETVLDMIRQKPLPGADDAMVGRGLRSQPKQEYERLIAGCRKEKQTLYERFVGEEISMDEYMTAKTVQDTEISRLTQASAALRKLDSARKTGQQLRELTEAAFRENTLSRDLVDFLIDKVRVFPDGKVAVDWKM